MVEQFVWIVWHDCSWYNFDIYQVFESLELAKEWAKSWGWQEFTNFKHEEPREHDGLEKPWHDNPHFIQGNKTVRILKVKIQKEKFW